MSATFRLGFVRDGYGKGRAHARAIGRRKRKQSKRSRVEALIDTQERVADLVESEIEAGIAAQNAIFDDDDYGFDGDDRFIGHLVDSAYKNGYEAGYAEGYHAARND